MAWLNLITSLILVGYSLFLVLRGRNINRTIYGINLFAGSWTLGVYLLVTVDQVVYDFMCWQTVTTWLIRPTLFILLCALISCNIRLGWKHD